MESAEKNHEARDITSERDDLAAAAAASLTSPHAAFSWKSRDDRKGIITADEGLSHSWQ